MSFRSGVEESNLKTVEEDLIKNALFNLLLLLLLHHNRGHNYIIFAKQMRYKKSVRTFNSNGIIMEREVAVVEYETKRGPEAGH